MIAKSKWFKQRKYGGWGVHPTTWKGWVYLFIVILPLILIQFVSIPNNTKLIITFLWLIFVIIDVFLVMVRLGKNDERDEKIEAMSERNASWAMMFVLVAGIIYELINSAYKEKCEVNLFLVAALFAGILAKSISNYVFKKRGI